MTLGIDEQGQNSVPSRFGALLTVFVYLVLTAYGAYKIMRIVEKKNYNIMQSREKGSFGSLTEEVDEFTADDGFKLAFSIRDQ